MKGGQPPLAARLVSKVILAIVGAGLLALLILFTIELAHQWYKLWLIVLVVFGGLVVARVRGR